MPRRDEHSAEGTFTLTGIDRVRQRAMKAFANGDDFVVPQHQDMRLGCKGELPRLDDLSGITLTTYYVDGYFPAAGQDLGVLTRILLSGQLALPRMPLSVFCHVTGMGKVGINSQEGKIHFEATLPDLLRWHDAKGREPILKRIIQAAHLSASVQRRTGWGGEEVEVECTVSRAGGVWYSDGAGTLGFVCELPRTSCEEGLRRVGAVLAELAATPQEYSWKARGYTHGQDDGVEMYEKLRGLKFQAERHVLNLSLRLTALDGLEALRCLAALHGRKQFRTTLCRLPLPADPATGRRRLAKVVVRTARDVHTLSLFLPSPHAALLPELGRKLGMRFSG
jgi:hypothetical protein